MVQVFLGDTKKNVKRDTEKCRQSLSPTWNRDLFFVGEDGSDFPPRDPLLHFFVRDMDSREVMGEATVGRLQHPCVHRRSTLGTLSK